MLKKKDTVENILWWQHIEVTARQALRMPHWAQGITKEQKQQLLKEDKKNKFPYMIFPDPGPEVQDLKTLVVDGQILVLAKTRYRRYFVYWKDSEEVVCCDMTEKEAHKKWKELIKTPPLPVAA